MHVSLMRDGLQVLGVDAQRVMAFMVDLQVHWHGAVRYSPRDTMRLVGNAVESHRPVFVGASTAVCSPSLPYPAGIGLANMAVE